MDSREQRIDNIIKLYDGQVSPEVIEELATLFPMYGGTVIAKLVLDLYDSLVYDDAPSGPKGSQQI